MTPRFRLLADAADITRRIENRLLELHITVTADPTSDTLTLTLDDRDHALPVLSHRTALQVWLGYDDDPPYMGRYLRTESTHELAPRRLGVRATAADFTQDRALKAPRTRSFDAITLGALLTRIAAEHGYTAACAPALAGIALAHIDQTEESDLHLLRRIAREHDATIKAAAGRLVLIARGAGRSARTGAPLPVLTLRPGDITRGRITHHDRPRYGAVIAKYYDVQSARYVHVPAGAGTPVLELRAPRPSPAHAQAAAAAKLARLARGTATAHLALPGSPGLVAEQPLALTGFRDGVDGAWTVTRARPSPSPASPSAPPPPRPTPATIPSAS